MTNRGAIPRSERHTNMEVVGEEETRVVENNESLRRQRKDNR
jgi:hypothetical protein